jgi:hypothetical protein
MQAFQSKMTASDAAVCSPEGTDPVSGTTRCLPVNRRIDIDLLHV